MLSLVLGGGGGVKSESDKDFQHRIVSKLVKKLLFSLQLIKEILGPSEARRILPPT